MRKSGLLRECVWLFRVGSTGLPFAKELKANNELVKSRENSDLAFSLSEHSSFSK